MADNPNRASGLSPVGHIFGANWSQLTRMYCIPSTDNNAYAVGDPVVLAGSADAAGVATVTLATAGTGNAVLGAIVSPAGAPAYGQPPGVPAETAVVIPATKTRAYYVMVCDDPGVIYEGQEDSVGGNIAAASIGLNVNLISGTNNGYVSGWLIDSSTVGAGATIQLKLLGAVQRIDNILGNTYCKFRVTINNHPLAPNTAGL